MGKKKPYRPDTFYIVSYGIKVPNNAQQTEVYDSLEKASQLVESLNKDNADKHKIYVDLYKTIPIKYKFKPSTLEIMDD